MAFNKHLKFNENIKLGLFVNDKSFKQMAAEIGTTEDAIKTVVYSRFKRDNKTPPLYKKVFDYLEKNCAGFKEHCQANNIALAS